MGSHTWGAAVGEPMYRMIANELQRQIEAGELKRGAQLKTEVELREEFGDVSRNTVRDAIKLLKAHGLVETRAGQGTFVMQPMEPFLSKLTTDPTAGDFEDTVYRSEVERRGRVPEETHPRVEVQRANEFLAQQLGLEPGAQVISRHQERRIDRTPWSMQTTFYPMVLLTRGERATRLLEASNVEGGMVDYLRKYLGVDQVAWRDTIIARPPTLEERTFFALSDKIPVAMFEFRRIGYDADGQPIRVTVTVYPADRNQFEMEAGPVPPPPGQVVQGME